MKKLYRKDTLKSSYHAESKISYKFDTAYPPVYGSFINYVDKKGGFFIQMSTTKGAFTKHFANNDNFEIVNFIFKRIFHTVLSNFSCHANLFLNESLYKNYFVTKVWDKGL